MIPVMYPSDWKYDEQDSSPVWYLFPLNSAMRWRAIGNLGKEYWDYDKLIKQYVIRRMSSWVDQT